jgi:hypothetical protein
VVPVPPLWQLLAPQLPLAPGPPVLLPSPPWAGPFSLLDKVKKARAAEAVNSRIFCFIIYRCLGKKILYQ